MFLGQILVKLKKCVLFEELFPHLKFMELTGNPRLVDGNFIGGYNSLPIRFSKIWLLP